jgi:hypothetical protein
MDADTLLKQYAIPIPCPMNWNQMDGDQSNRYCAACGKHVHDLTAMTPEEAAGLIRFEPAGFCGRAYANDEGMLATSANQGLPPRTRPLQFTIRSIMGVVAGVAATLGVARLFADHSPPPAPRPLMRNPTRILGKMVPSRLQPRESPSSALPLPAAHCGGTEGA